jgi:hypothetical protein
MEFVIYLFIYPVYLFIYLQQRVSLQLEEAYTM